MDPKNSLKILLVDDDVIQSVLVAKKLENNGFSCKAVPSGEAAWEILSEETFDLILLDLDLGSGMDGVETASLILKKMDIPIVFFSSHTGEEVLKKTEIIPHYGYILKNSGDFILSSGIRKAWELFLSKQELKKTSILFQGIAENVSEIFWMEDLIENKILYMTPSFEKIFGISRDLVYEDPQVFLERVVPEDKDRLLESFGNFLEKKESISLEYRILTQDKKIREIFVRFYPIEIKEEKITKLVGFAEDRTVQNEQIRIRKSKENELKKIVEHLPIPALFVDENLIFLDWNEAAEKVFGYKKEEVMGISAYDMIIPPEEKNSVAEVPRKVQNNTQTLHHTNWNTRKDGEKIYCDWWNTPIYDAEGKFEGIICIAQDITKIKEKEESMQSQIFQKETLLKEIHHRVKNNMATIGSLLDIQAYSTQDPSAKEHLKDARNRINGMMRIYDKLFHSSNYKSTSLRGYLTTLVEDLAQVSPHSAVEWDSSIEDLELETSILFPVGIIVNEIVTNSLKHGFPPHFTGKITLRGEKKGDLYNLTIQDNGIGWEKPRETSQDKSKMESQDESERESQDESNIESERETSENKQESGSGFGLELMGILTQQIHGKIDRLQLETGIGYKLDFPIPM